MRGNKTMKALLIAAFAAALCFALAACGGSSSSSAASSAASSGSASASAASTSASSASASAASASSAVASASSASASAASKSATSANASDLVDEHKNITLYSILTLTGPELTNLLEQNEYVWSGSNKVWQRQVDGAMFAAANDNGGWDKDKYEQATGQGGASKAMVANVVGGYENGQKALSGNAHCVIEDSFFNDDGSGIAIVYGPTMEEHLVIVTKATESTWNIDMYSKEAVGSGLLDKVYGQNMGGSLQEVWKNVTGKDSYGH